MTRVLVVEDSPTQAEELRLILESEGFSVDKAPDGRAGLTRLNSQSFDLVVSDILMPGMTGYELCRAMKADPAKRETPVILLTTLADPMDIIQGLECGADNFITKPYEPTHLVGRVRAILDNVQLRRAGKVQVGIEILFLGKTFNITSDKEQILGLLVSTFEDVVRTHQALKHSHADLARRTEELERAERALRLNSAQLEAANRDLESFSYSVSHDLRAPLRAIDGFARMLSEEYADRLDSEGKRLLGVILSRTERMGQLTEALLTLSRDSNRPLRPGSIEMIQMVREVLTELSASRPNVEFRVGQMPPAMGDSTLIRQVWANLLSNALKYSAGREKAVVEVGGSEAPGETSYFVRDNGVGFDMAHAAKLFQVFQRLHSQEQFEGSGIGLALVERIIRRHGGRVWAESKEGEGATFNFTLPRKPQP